MVNNEYPTQSTSSRSSSSLFITYEISSLKFSVANDSFRSLGGRFALFDDACIARGENFYGNNIAPNISLDSLAIDIFTFEESHLKVLY